MKVINYRVSLDMFDTLSQVTIKAKKGDSACKIHITLTKNGKIYKISEDCRATFNAKKADGNFVYDNCTIEGDTIVYDFSSSIDENGTCQVSACEGNVECEVTLFKGSEQLTSPRFTLVIDGTVYNGEEIISTPESDVLKKLIDDVETKLENGEFKGEKGDPGAVKFVVVSELPEVGDENVMYLLPNTDVQEKNNYDEYIFTNNTWEKIGTASVEVDLTDYVKNTDYAGYKKAGVVELLVGGTYGIDYLYGTISSEGNNPIKIAKANNNEIDDKKDLYKPIVPKHLDYAIKVGLTTNQETWTEEEKKAARDLIGVTEIIGDIGSALDELHNYAQRLIGGAE